MAGASGSSAHDLVLLLQEEGPLFDFFAAVRRIECANPDKPRIGTSQKPADDPVRFCQEPSMAFPLSTLEKVTPDPLANVPRVYVQFAGLTGPNGPLPLYMTDLARERIVHHNDHTLARFMDVFHHRLISLFYRAWAINQQVVSFEHGQHDSFAEYVATMFGDGMDSAHRRDSVGDSSKLHYAGRLGPMVRSPEGLEAVLSDYFRIPTRVDEFAGEWIELPKDSRCRLGEAPMTGTLGSTAIVGSKIWERQYKFRLVMGPMGYADYERMLPGGESLVRLRDWVKNYIGEELAWDVQLILRKEEVPAAQLGKSGRLGWSTWAKVKPLPRDADSLILNPKVN